ncbi:MAG: SUMF1/EgtB/PvdO family nonheme iron enzyme [Rubrivivax sp.]|nr:SUMF1/EgtB/PvdO family nonheme iron enzyme [Rubrivivax sp.]
MHDELGSAAAVLDASGTAREAWGAAVTAREGRAEDLTLALRESRRDTLATFGAYEAALPDLLVPQRAELNPPLWELGHIGWFQEFWIGRNPARHLGPRADPDTPRRPPGRAHADALYHSSQVPHGTRWSLPLPTAQATRADLAGQLAQTLQCLEDLPDEDEALYFHRLALLHEDMHHEAALYMAQGLGIAIADPRWQPRALPAPRGELAFDAGTWTLGMPHPRGFAFDNEVGAAEVEVPALRIDAQVVRWGEFMPFVDEGGYEARRFWSEAGWAWLQARAATEARSPRHVRRALGLGGWECWRHGRWIPLDPCLAARHLTLHEAEAWCRWAGRRLPSEAEWERAALTRPEAFEWGEVWEWTASPFQPFVGFEPHPYRDYSAPWFDGRPVLRGASFMTQPRMKHPRYRNFFQAHRNDVPAGFRSCAI